MPDSDIRLRGSARTSTGKVRENNEDNIYLWARDNYILAVVADGMGGAAAGEEASRIAVETIHRGLIDPDNNKPLHLEEWTDDLVSQRVRDSIRSANALIMDRAGSSPEFRGMGTTVTLAFLRGRKAVLAHVGDSRAYLVSGHEGSITQITADHSFVEALVAAGHITEEQAEEHPMRHVLYRALGQSDDVDVDLHYKQLQIGDRLVLCSDGLTRHVKSDEIAKLVIAEPNPDIASQRLVDLANERGGEDNVSVIVIAIEQDDPAERASMEAAAREDGEDTLPLRGRIPPRYTAPGTDNPTYRRMGTSGPAVSAGEG